MMLHKKRNLLYFNANFLQNLKVSYIFISQGIYLLLAQKITLIEFTGEIMPIKIVYLCAFNYYTKSMQ